VDYFNYNKHYVRNVSNLAKEIRCYDNVCKNEKVIDNENDSGRVLRVFDNGKALVDFDKYKKHYIKNIRSLSKVTTNRCLGNFCIGSKVIDSENDIGRILEVFDNGKALIDYDKYNKHYVRKTRNLALSYRCSDGLCVGDRVIDNENNTGRVLTIFDDGKVQIDYDNYNRHYVRTLRSLGYKIDCYN